MIPPSRIAAMALAAFAVTPALPQEFFRCTAPDGRVTYQQAPCASAEAERRIDATPANTDYDPAQRERLLREGEEAGRRLEERAAREREEARLRQEQRERDAQRERETQAREAAREEPVYVIGGPGYFPPPRPPLRPTPLPRPPSPSPPASSPR
jgi:hypothetical protein